MAVQRNLIFDQATPRQKDVFLCHTGVDKPWVRDIAQKIEETRHDGRFLGVILDEWDFDKGKNFVLEIDKWLDQVGFVLLVVSKAMLNAEWPTMERTAAIHSDPSGRKGRVIVLLLENVDLPPSLRIRTYIDFRDPTKFEESFLELICTITGVPRRRGTGSLSLALPSASLPYKASPVIISASIGADRAHERLVSNLLPVTAIPQVIQVGKTSLRDKADLPKSENAETPPCILRGGKLYTFSDLHDIANPLGSCIEGTPKDESFEAWFNDEDRRRWAVEILNVCFRQHCWKRWLRLDAKGHRYYFMPRHERPVRIWWVPDRRRPREVTARHMARRKTEDGQLETYQCGWRHQGIKAEFLHLPLGLALRITPTYLLTHMDGKSPRGGKYVGPILSHWLNQERNGQILRSIRFWSLVLTRGIDKGQLVIKTGHEEIVVGLAPASGDMAFGISSDTIDWNRLLNAEFEDDLALPDLSDQKRQMSLFGDPS